MTTEYQAIENNLKDVSEEIVKLLIGVRYIDDVFIMQDGKRSRESLEDKIFKMILVKML